MAKDDFIGVRVNKEFKAYLQKEAKKKGVSLAKYVEDHLESNFKDTKSCITSLIENAKEQRPEFWREAEKTGILREIEFFITVLITDYISPVGNAPQYHPIHMLSIIKGLVQANMNHMDSIAEEHKEMAADSFIGISQSIADNLNKFKSSDKKTRHYFISEIRKLIESYCFNFTSQAFAKDSFLKIKEELDKTEQIILKGDI